MKMNGDLSIIHAYLCGDGYVAYGHERKYYRMGFRNTNLVLLKDFKKRFDRYFKVNITLKEGERCYKSSKEIYWKLTNQFGSFYSREWTMPELSRNLSKKWLRAFFDCEGWVYCKTHQNRHIGLDSINEKGIDQVIKALNNLGINTIKKVNKKRGMFRIFIYRKESLIKFSKEIGFLHPDKAKKLEKTLKDYVEYFWNFPKKGGECKNFIDNILKEKARIKKPYYVIIISREQINLKKLKVFMKKFYNIESLLYRSINGLGTIYHQLNINRRDEVQKLIDNKLIPNIFKQK